MSQKTLRVLLVEDSKGDARLLQEMLAETHAIDCECIHVSSVGDAVETLAAKAIDVVLLDLSLPDSYGLATLDRIKQESTGSPIVVLTGFGDDRAALAAVQEGAQDYLVKGEFDTRTLVRAILYAVERSRAEKGERDRHGLEAALSAMDHLLAVLGHELRTPLTSLRLLTEYLLDENMSTEAQREHHLRAINSEVIRMTTLVNNLLEAARIDSGASQWNWSNVNAAAVCREAIELLEPLHDPAKVQLALEVEPEDIEFNGDPDAIRRLVVNLVNNALKHTRKGRISILVRRLRYDDKSFITFQVRDTGDGIPDEVVKRLGVAFATSVGAVGSLASCGTGLGLTICKRIAAVHGGTLSVSTALHQGSTFTVTLRADLPEPTPVTDDAKILREAAA